MKTQFTPVAMKCNQEQFDAIELKLKSNKIRIDDVTDFNTNDYLTNNWSQVNPTIANHQKKHSNFNLCKIYEIWDEEIFLNACGIETEQKDLEKFNYLLSLESIDSVKETVLEWFPELKPKELEVGKWYIYEDGAIQFNKEKGKGYGINSLGCWIEMAGWLNHKCNGKFTLATSKEVQQALEKEAVKRGFVDIDKISVKLLNGIVLKNGSLGCFGNSYSYNEKNNTLDLDGVTFFKDGIWAEIIPNEIHSDIKSKIENALGDKDFVKLCEKYFGCTNQ